MAVASRSAVPIRRRQVPSRARAIVASNPKDRGKTIAILPSSQAVPLWFLNLCAWQRRFSVATLVLVVTTLAIYSWTVYCQQNWNQAYRKLVTLQRDERQLTTESEELKHLLAQQAEKPEMELLPPNPAQTIFLPAPEHPTTAVLTTKLSERTQQLTPTPLGY